MSKINDLIKELCPNGVIFKKLDEACTKIYAGGTPSTSHEGYYGGNIKWLRSGEINFNELYDTEIKITDAGLNNSSAKIIPSHSVVIAMTGATVARTAMIMEDMSMNQSVCALIPKDELNYRFLYQLLSNKYLELKQSGQGVLTSLNLDRIKKITIPVPPIEVQEEIVRILDKFGELEAELEARKSQYEFWRGKLLNDGNELVKLKEICTYSNDRISYDKLNEDNYVGVDNLLQNKKGKTKSYHVPTSGNSTKFEKNDILVGNIRPYLRKIWFADCYGGTNGDVLDIRVNDTKKIYPRFLYYVLSSEAFFEYNNSNSKGAKMPRGDKQAIMNYDFAVPSIEKQIHIANVLDQFDKLVNNISVGLPAEIELRRKQYEYYRNKLLSFEEL